MKNFSNHITSICILTAMILTPLLGQSQNKLLIGFWKPADADENLLVQVYENSQGRIEGKIINDYAGKLDPRNPASHKNKVIISGFTHSGDYIWEGGQILDPEDGNHYNGRITLMNSNRIEVRGYGGLFGLFSKDMDWIKVHDNRQNHLAKK